MTEPTASDDGLTEAERQYLTTGEITDALVKENADTPPNVVAEPAPAQESEEEAEVAESGEADTSDKGEVSAPEQGTDGEKAEGTDQRRRIPRREYEEMRAARLKAEKDYQELQVQNARVAERLNLLQQAIQEPPKAEPEAPQRPDPEQDIFAYTRWLEEQLNSVTSKVNTYEEQITTGQQEMDRERQYLESMNAYAGQQPDFVHAYNHLLRSRAAELVARSYQVTPDQLQGIMDGRVRIPKEIGDALRQEERELYRNAFERGADPAATIYQYATMRGYRKQAAPAAPAAPAGGTPGTSLGGTPAAPAAAPQRQGAAPTASQIVESIKKGQAASATLSKTGGVAPDTQLTPQALAEMSDAQFEALFTELQNRGDKAELQRLFGA